jgi:hypothetical protein
VNASYALFFYISVIENGPVGCLHSIHVGGALLKLLDSFEVRCVPSFQCVQLEFVCSSTSAGTSERHMAIAAVLYGLAFQHRALLHIVVKGIIKREIKGFCSKAFFFFFFFQSVLAGSSPTRLKRLVDRFGPILFDCSFGSELLFEIVNSPEEAFNSRCQFGAWQPCAVSHVLVAAPLPVLVQIAAHPLFQEIDVVAAHSLLFSHQDLLNSPSQLMNALCQIYSINGGSAKRLMDWRTGSLKRIRWLFLFFHKQKQRM